MDDVRRAETAVLIALAVGGLLAIIGSAVAVWLGIRRGLIPVRRLGRAVEEIDTRELALDDGRGPYPQELRPIVSALEGLLARLRGAMERERRFTDAAAHELRTPIAELKTITDVADRWPEPERLHRSVKDAQIVVRQMEDLLESLLAAARGATADGHQAVEAVNLIPLARAVSAEAAERLHRSDVSWSFEGEDDASWDGPRGVIVALVRNLIDNAAEYTPAGGAVRVRALMNGRATAFEVENGPVALEDSEIDRIFEPFWRADASRTDRAHRGLGLSIVESLAAALGLRPTATITPERHLRVRLVSDGHSEPD
jgi:two-component system sensor histidine kinase QseC